MIIEHASPFFPAEAQGRKDSKKGNDLAVYICHCNALRAWRLGERRQLLIWFSALKTDQE
jgi:hypothetical protein